MQTEGEPASDMLCFSKSCRWWTKYKKRRLFSQSYTIIEALYCWTFVSYFASQRNWGNEI